MGGGVNGIIGRDIYRGRCKDGVIYRIGCSLNVIIKGCIVKGGVWKG